MGSRDTPFPRPRALEQGGQVLWNTGGGRDLPWSPGRGSLGVTVTSAAAGRGGRFSGCVSWGIHAAALEAEI